MASEVALNPSRVKKDGQWQPVRHNSYPSPRPYPPNSLTRRLTSVTAKLKRGPFATIKESPVPSLESNSSVSLGFKAPLPPAWIHSSEHLIYIHPSRQLQDYQSASSRSVYRGNEFDEASSSPPRIIRTQSQWMAPPSASYVPSGLLVPEEPSIIREIATSGLNIEDPQEPGEHPVPVSGDLPREAIADLFDRVEDYEREHPDKIKEAGKVGTRVSEVGHNLTKTLKTMGSLRRKQTFEARLECESASTPRRRSATYPFDRKSVSTRSQHR